ncbi:hypothetical protein evm_007098 [Chilo suppressalis]|nr:hypothetical protein evm_007098 [Chilo suppressalis]
MNWDNATVLRFIKLYQTNSCIWNPKNVNHKNRKCVDEAWNNIREDLGLPCTVRDLKKKKESLMSAYRSYKIKIMKSQIAGTDDVYQPSWFAFPVMDNFLKSVYICSVPANTEGEEGEKQTRHISDTEETSERNFVFQTEQEYLQPRMSTTSQYPSSRARHRPSTVTHSAAKRKHQSPPELVHAQKQMTQAFNFMKKLQEKQRSKEDYDDDEYSVFGVLVAKKLRKLPEGRRDVMMVKINQLFVDERDRSYLDVNNSKSPSDIKVFCFSSSSEEEE